VIRDRAYTRQAGEALRLAHENKLAPIDPKAVMMRLRLQMLMPVSAKCSWKRRTSSGAAVSGDRFRNAAKRLQLKMWLRIPTIATTDSDGSRPPVPIDRDQCGSGADGTVG
jgi:hypothetical protein